MGLQKPTPTAKHDENKKKSGERRGFGPRPLSKETNGYLFIMCLYLHDMFIYIYINTYSCMCSFFTHICAHVFLFIHVYVYAHLHVHAHA